MPAAQPLRLVPPASPYRTARLRPEERRRSPVAGRRTRVAVLSRQGPASLHPDDLRRVAQIADVTFHALDQAPELAAARRLLRDVDVLATTNACLPALDADLLDAAPHLRGVVLRASGRDHIDVRLLEARGVGLDVLPALIDTSAAAAVRSARRLWGAHLLAALDDQPLGAVTWPSASAPPLRGAM